MVQGAECHFGKHCVTASLGVGRSSFDRLRMSGRGRFHPHPRIKYGAGSNPLPGRERGREIFGGCEVLRNVYNIVDASRDAPDTGLAAKI